MKKQICILLIAVHLSACATYERRAVSFRPPQDYSNYYDAAGLLVGAEAYAEAKKAEDAFGFDIHGAGALPVQLALDKPS